MSLEERVQDLERAVAELRSQVAALRTERPHTDEGAPQEQGALMKEVAEKLALLARDGNGAPKPLIVQSSMVPGNTWISMESQEGLRHGIDAGQIVRLAAVLSSEPRVRLIKELLVGEKSAAEVGAATGMEGGPLYHHLNELQDGGFIQQAGRGRYAMTRRGRDLYYHMALLVRTPYDREPAAVTGD